jgi:hypothetical protein
MHLNMSQDTKISLKNLSDFRSYAVFRTISISKSLEYRPALVI